MHGALVLEVAGRSEASEASGGLGLSAPEGDLVTVVAVPAEDGPRLAAATLEGALGAVLVQ